MQPFLLLMAFLLAPQAEAGKIIGGHEVEPHSRPYMAYLRVKKPGYTARCGGFLVREDFVLTAAHCQGCNITVTLGAHNISNKSESTQQVIKVKKSIPHPKYDRKTKANDIMLLQLEREAKLTNAVSVLRLPKKGVMVKPGMMCRVAGWGCYNLINTSDVLLEVQLEIQTDDLCNSYRSYNKSIEICVGNPNKIQSTFSGDSGGPLVCGNLALGIVSFGNDNGKPPRVETKISSFLSWIKETMRRFQLQRPD
ncbi:mast cell protease 1A-like [Saccopteryx leptura]|uniref:mast cell protease 1A-like n=1 Tax=Saccopteryx leptura TaxID=249018 RepID=UPI00339BD912